MANSPALDRYLGVERASVSGSWVRLPEWLHRANGAHLTHHWGFMTGSMTSPDFAPCSGYLDGLKSRRRDTRAYKLERSWDYPWFQRIARAALVRLIRRFLRGNVSCPEKNVS